MKTGTGNAKSSSEPIVWDLTSSEVTQRVLYILSDASGALIIFGLLVVYFKMQTHQPISRDPDDQSSFVGAKKLIALVLLASLAVIATVFAIALTWVYNRTASGEIDSPS
jgi:ABC-type glucose/galactose transport system permease subunit